MLVKSHRLSVNFPFSSSMRIENSEVLFVPFCEKSWHPTCLQLKHDSACIEHWQISIHWIQTNRFYRPFIHCSSDSDSHLCFYSVPLGLLHCLLAGCPKFLIDRMQKVQNAAAQIICSTKKKKKKKTMSNPFFSHYTGYQSRHEYSIKFPHFAPM